MSTLDKEFRELIQSKIDAAGKLLNEANELAKSKDENLFDLSSDYGNEDLENEDDTSVEMGPVIRELSRAGWSTSSMGC
jgi:hypothetical protein